MRQHLITSDIYLTVTFDIFTKYIGLNRVFTDYLLRITNCWSRYFDPLLIRIDEANQDIRLINR